MAFAKEIVLTGATQAEPFASCEDPQELKNFSPVTAALFCTRKDEQEVKRNAGTGAFGQFCLLMSRKYPLEFALHYTEQYGPFAVSKNPDLSPQHWLTVPPACRNFLKLSHPVL